MDTLAKPKILSVLFVGVVLAGYLSSAATGMLVCLGDDAARDCCRYSKTALPSRAAEVPQILGQADCDCCIAVDALPANAGASPYKASLDLAPGPTCFRNAVLPSIRRAQRAASGNGGDARLTSLRTIVLLV